MTKDEIMALAKQAGFERLGHDEHDYVCYPDEIVGFAELVAAKEREEVERLKALCQEMLSELYAYRASEHLKNVTATIKARGLA